LESGNALRSHSGANATSEVGFVGGLGSTLEVAREAASALGLEEPSSRGKGQVVAQDEGTDGVHGVGRDSVGVAVCGQAGGDLGDLRSNIGGLKSVLEDEGEQHQVASALAGTAGELVDVKDKASGLKGHQTEESGLFTLGINAEFSKGLVDEGS